MRNRSTFSLAKLMAGGCKNQDNTWGVAALFRDRVAQLVLVVEAELSGVGTQRSRHGLWHRSDLVEHPAEVGEFASPTDDPLAAVVCADPSWRE